MTETTDIAKVEPAQVVTLEPEQLRLMQAAALQAERFEASQMCQHLIARAKAFEESLPEDAEIGLRLASFGMAASLHVRAIGYKDPNIIEFHGVDDTGRNLSLIQHLSQLSVLFVAMKPVEAKPYRVGFTVDDGPAEEA